MIKYIGKRLLQIIPVLIGIAILVFFIMRMIPGDPARVMLGQDATPEEIERIRAILGLDKNIFVQLGVFLKNMFTFNLGDSIFLNQPVSKVLIETFPATLELTTVALLISLLIAVPLGVISAIKQNTWIDYTSMAFAQIGISMPVFWIGVLLILAFSVELGWLPSFGRGESLIQAAKILFTTGKATVLIESLKKILLPALAMGIVGSAIISRMVRSAMLEVLDSDYIRTARAKGTVEGKVIMKHAFRNALLPIVTIVGLEFGLLIGNSIITETVFAWPGVGRVVVSAISQRDYPMVQGGVVFLAFSFSIINLLVDLLYTVINPKIRH